MSFRLPVRRASLLLGIVLGVCSVVAALFLQESGNTTGALRRGYWEITKLEHLEEATCSMDLECEGLFNEFSRRFTLDYPAQCYTGTCKGTCSYRFDTTKCCKTDRDCKGPNPDAVIANERANVCEMRKICDVKNYTCDIDTREDVSCDDQNGCTQNDVCKWGACNGESTCKEGEKCISGQCTADECIHDLQCLLNQRCQNGKCGPACTSDDDCGNTDDVCQKSSCENGNCSPTIFSDTTVECTDSNDSTINDACNGAGSCVGEPCPTGATDNGSNECECPFGQEMKDGVCQPKEEPLPDECEEDCYQPECNTDDDCMDTTSPGFQCSASYCRGEGQDRKCSDPIYQPSSTHCDDKNETTVRDYCDGYGGCAGTQCPFGATATDRDTCICPQGQHFEAYMCVCDDDLPPDSFWGCARNPQELNEDGQPRQSAPEEFDPNPARNDPFNEPGNTGDPVGGAGGAERDDDTDEDSDEDSDDPPTRPPVRVTPEGEEQENPTTETTTASEVEEETGVSGGVPPIITEESYEDDLCGNAICDLSEREGGCFQLNNFYVCSRSCPQDCLFPATDPSPIFREKVPKPSAPSLLTQPAQSDSDFDLQDAKPVTEDIPVKEEPAELPVSTGLRHARDGQEEEASGEETITLPAGDEVEQVPLNAGEEVIDQIMEEIPADPQLEILEQTNPVFNTRCDIAGSICAKQGLGCNKTDYFPFVQCVEQGSTLESSILSGSGRSASLPLSVFAAVGIGVAFIRRRSAR